MHVDWMNILNLHLMECKGYEKSDSYSASKMTAIHKIEISYNCLKVCIFSLNEEKF